jgi:hypothetical protein
MPDSLQVNLHAQQGTTILTFLKKIKNTGPLMGAKLKSKTHLQNTFFDFLSHFLRVWLQLFQRIRNQREILRFLTPFLIFSKIFFLRSYLYFFRTLTANAQETAQKTENLFL